MIYLYTTMLALSHSGKDDNDDNLLKEIPEHNNTHHLCATDDLLSNVSALSALATPVNENIRYVSRDECILNWEELQASSEGVSTCRGSTEILPQKILKS